MIYVLPIAIILREYSAIRLILLYKLGPSEIILFRFKERFGENDFPGVLLQYIFNFFHFSFPFSIERVSVQRSQPIQHFAG